ncbi:hypothetical protein VULLAG_LOCUS10788 [Vulpes lagopus]
MDPKQMTDNQQELKKNSGLEPRGWSLSVCKLAPSSFDVRTVKPSALPA